MKTKVLHLRLNPASAAKQERVEEVEQLRVECDRLRERLRKMEAGGAVTSDDTTLVIPPSQEILGTQTRRDRFPRQSVRLPWRHGSRASLFTPLAPIPSS